jgi:O-antigen/teichoic acid export membrane protein
MLAQARDRSDSIVVGRLLGTAQVGVFAVGLELGSLPVTELVEPLGRALFSGFASLHNASEGLSNMFRGAVGLGLMLILPAGFGISMVADPMVRLCLGEHWLVAVPVIQIMAIGGTTAIFTLSSGTLMNAIGKPNITFHISVAATVVKIIALLLLVPRYGLPGAAIALVGSSGIECLVLLWVTLPRIGVSLRQLAGCVVRPAIATSAMVIVLWYLGMAWTPSSGREIVAIGLDTGERCAVGAVCYGVMLLAMWLGAGRPDGAERYALTMAGKTWRRIRRWA